MSDSLQPLGLQTTRLLCRWNVSRQEYWRGLHFLLQTIFPTRDRTYNFVPLALAGGFFTTSATREAPCKNKNR